MQKLIQEISNACIRALGGEPNDAQVTAFLHNFAPANPAQRQAVDTLLSYLEKRP